MTHADALVVDRKGLAKKLGHRPKSFVLFELLQNAWDAPGCTMVSVLIHTGGGRCQITVQDNAPAGFTSLASVYTLFRDSEKAGDPEKRGRFELGEKLVAALALRLVVATTKGTVIIDGDERTVLPRRRLDVGSRITVNLRLTKDEQHALTEDAARLIAPAGIETTICGVRLPTRTPVSEFEATLQTVRADDDGVLRPTQRKATVRVYEPEEGEVAYLYEMGIPVVETGDRFHYDVQQRVPVNFERSSVPPAYLKTLRVEALNALHGLLTGPSDVLAPWVTDALDDARCAPTAVQEVVRARFGPKAVIYDPSDPEGSKMAVAKGYTVVPGGSFSTGAWKNIRRDKALLPAGQVTPSPKVYDPDGRPENVLDRDAWFYNMRTRALFCDRLFRPLVKDVYCRVVIVSEPSVSWSANFGPEGEGFRLCLNHAHLKDEWFDLPHRSVEVLDLLLHEFCHATVMDHLSHAMHETATRLGAKLAGLALDNPSLFE